MKKRFSKILGVGVTLALLTSLLIGVAPVAGDVSSATVTLSNYEISQANVTYTLTFNLGADLAEGQTITVKFPTDTDLTTTDDAVGNVTMSATSGLGSTAFDDKNSGGLDGETTAGTLVITVGDVNDQNKIGAGALVQLVITKVVNAPAVGATTLSVKTATEATEVASQSFTLTAPTIEAVPGIVSGYNSAGVKVYEDTGDNAINNAITAGVARVVIGPGTYAENVAIDVAGITLESSGTAAETIINGTVLISKNSTLDGVTVNKDLTINAGADDNVTVSNCVLAATAVITQGATITLSGNTHNVADADIGIDANDAVTVSDSDFNIAGAGVGIDVAAAVTVTGSTLSGASGTGIVVSAAAGDVTISGSTFSGLNTALAVDAGTLDISGSTISGCGVVDTSAAIDVDGATKVTIVNNTIADCVDEILNVAANEDKVFMNFNTITNPAKGITSAAASVDATNNLWDGGVAPPVTSTNADTSPYLTAAVSNQSIAPAAQTIGGTTVGVLVEDTANWANAGIATYAANPGTAAVPGEAFKYFDVYVAGAGSADVDLTFYGASDTTQLYAWSVGQGIWVQVGATYDSFQGVLTFTVTDTTTPSLTNLAGLPFALTEPAAPAPVLGITLLTPENGALNVSVNPNFTWTAAPDAVEYHFEIAEEPTDPRIKDPFLIRDYGLTTTITGCTAKETLKYNTTYYWRARGAVDADTVGAWASGFFTTEPEPKEEAPPIVVKEQPPTPAPILKSPDVVVQVPPSPAPVQVIPDYLLWVIIGVGAVLVIAVIVLIVRTRRVT